jgi:SAM-dependent methyltransferase
VTAADRRGDDRLARTQAFWDSLTGEEGEFARQAEYGRAMWAAEPNWGDWSIPEAELRLLPDVAGMDAIELGCGTAYFSGWLARAGARPVGLDASERQLTLAGALQAEHGVEFPLVRADAEDVPYPDGSFDLVLSSTARAAGAIRTDGCPRRPGCCGRPAGCCSSWSARS